MQSASRRCGTGIRLDRDITGSGRDVDEPGASLPAVPPGRARAPRGNCRLFDTEGEIPRETDCLLEGNGFELPVPRPIGKNFEALSEMGTPR